MNVFATRPGWGLLGLRSTAKIRESFFDSTHIGVSSRAIEIVRNGPSVVFGQESCFDSLHHVGPSGLTTQNVHQGRNGRHHPSQAPVVFGCPTAIHIGGSSRAIQIATKGKKRNGPSVVFGREARGSRPRAAVAGGQRRLRLEAVDRGRRRPETGGQRRLRLEAVYRGQRRLRLETVDRGGGGCGWRQSVAGRGGWRAAVAYAGGGWPRAAAAAAGGSLPRGAAVRGQRRLWLEAVGRGRRQLEGSRSCCWKQSTAGSGGCG